SATDGLGAPAFLDTRPAQRENWLLIGCERSLAFHRHFYGDDPPWVNFCPRTRRASGPDDRVLTKCCVLERGVESDGRTAVVPWGSSLQEIAGALRSLAGLDQ